MESLPRPFIDAHVHFWNRGRIDVPWLDEVPALPDRAEPLDLAAAAGDAAPDGVVFVEADCSVDHRQHEAEWVAGLAASGAPIRGIVASAPLELGDGAEGALDRLASLDLVRGVRRLVQGEPPGFALSDEFVAGVRGLANRGLSFDLCIQPGQIQEAATLVEACPDTTVVLDHCGKPPIAEGELEAWREGFARIAACPNASCKLSGLVTEADPESWTTADLKPCVDHALAEFGTQRLMFGSDWPVVGLAARYREWIESALVLLASRSDAERDAIFRDNARRVYRLDG